MKSLTEFPTEVWLNAIGPSLTDTVRAVRIAAADLLITVPSARIPQSYSTAFARAKSELEQYTLFHTDLASGDAMAGDYYLKIQDYHKAEKFYLLGLKKDTALNYARMNLSVLYSIEGQNREALKVLQDALQTDPKNARIYFNLGLIYNEMKESSKAEESLSKAVALKSQNPRVYYNYGLMLEQHGKINEAITIFGKGLELSPLDGDINYALSILYLQSGQIKKARRYALLLKKYYPNNPNYQGLFQQMKF